MRGQGPTMGGQAPCCGGDRRVRQIQIAKVIIGIVGLDDALNQLYRLGRPPGPETAEELLIMIRTRNYFRSGDEEEYKAALLREYRAYWERRNPPGQGEEKGR